MLITRQMVITLFLELLCTIRPSSYFRGKYRTTSVARHASSQVQESTTMCATSRCADSTLIDHVNEIHSRVNRYTALTRLTCDNTGSRRLKLLVRSSTERLNNRNDKYNLLPLLSKTTTCCVLLGRTEFFLLNSQKRR